MDFLFPGYLHNKKQGYTFVQFFMVLDFKVREVIYREISNLFLFYPYKNSQICCITYKIFMHSSIFTTTFAIPKAISSVFHYCRIP